MTTTDSTEARELAAIWRHRIAERAGRLAAAEQETEHAAQLVAQLQAALASAQHAHRDAEARQVAELHHLADIRRAAREVSTSPARPLAPVVELFPGRPAPSEQLPADVAALAEELRGILPASLIEQVSRDFLAERPAQADAIDAAAAVELAALVAEGREDIAADDAAGAAMLAELDRSHAVDLDALQQLAAVPSPTAEEDAATLARLGVAEDVAGRVLAYLDTLNRQELAANVAGPFPRHRVFSVDQPARPGKYVRLVSLDAFALAKGERTGSVLSFLETGTGRLRQADGWKRPGPRVIANLGTEAGAARLYGPNGRAF